MSIEFFDETMTVFVNRVPYKPFTVVLVNGNRFEIDHPRAVVYRDGGAVYLGPGSVPVIFDHEGVSEFVGDLSGKADE
jgi:hypothetical protein